MEEHKAKQTIEDVMARKALWEFLWKAAHDHEAKGGPNSRPIPIYDDEWGKIELERILNPKRKKFLGLF